MNVSYLFYVTEQENIAAGLRFAKDHMEEEEE